MRRAQIILALIAATLAASPALAQDSAADYPKKPIKIIVAVPAGGGIDSITRILAEKLRQRLKQTITVENRGGQSGNLGAEAVASSEPDGYTLLATVPAPITVNALLYKKLLYDPEAFEPVAVMTIIPNTLAVRPDFPANSAREFLSYAKANPGKLNYASQGNGTTSHLSAELFQRVTGTRLVHVPYKGTGPAINDLIASHVDLMFLEMAAATELHRSGRVKILALATRERAATLPEIPTLRESGVTDFESVTWNAILAPPKTPKAIVAKLNKAIVEALNEPDIRAQFGSLNAQSGTMNPAEMAAFIKSETQRWGDVIRAANISIN